MKLDLVIIVHLSDCNQIMDAMKKQHLHSLKRSMLDCVSAGRGKPKILNWMIKKGWIAEIKNVKYVWSFVNTDSLSCVVVETHWKTFFIVRYVASWHYFASWMSYDIALDTKFPTPDIQSLTRIYWEREIDSIDSIGKFTKSFHDHQYATHLMDFFVDDSPTFPTESITFWNTTSDEEFVVVAHGDPDPKYDSSYYYYDETDNKWIGFEKTSYIWITQEKNRASQIIQNAVRDWLHRPTYKSGNIGFYCRKAIDSFGQYRLNSSTS